MVPSLIKCSLSAQFKPGKGKSGLSLFPGWHTTHLHHWPHCWTEWGLYSSDKWIEPKCYCIINEWERERRKRKRDSHYPFAPDGGIPELVLSRKMMQLHCTEAGDALFFFYCWMNGHNQHSYDSKSLSLRQRPWRMWWCRIIMKWNLLGFSQNSAGCPLCEKAAVVPPHVLWLTWLCLMIGLPFRTDGELWSPNNLLEQERWLIIVMKWQVEERRGVIEMRAVKPCVLLCLWPSS